jgi:hypothetical protein
MENNKCDVLDTKQQIHKHFKWNEDICKFFHKKTWNVINHQKFDLSLSNIKHVQISRAS